MSWIRILTAIALLATAVVAVAFNFRFGEPEPVAAVPAPPAAPIVDYTLPNSIQLTQNDQGVPVFGFPERIFRPVPDRDRRIIDVDAVYRELQPPPLGPLSASPVSVCSVRLLARRAPVAMVALSVNAPCFPQTTFEIRQGPLRFTVVTDQNGRVSLDVPAIDLRSGFAILSDNIQHDSVEVVVPEVRSFDRVAIQWDSAEKLQLHAFEGGAFIGGAGHIWSGADQTVGDAQSGLYGFVTRFGSAEGDTPLQAEVYTFPAGLRMSDGRVALRISNLIHSGNCGREVDFKVIEVIGGMAPKVTHLSPRMPACGQAGFAVLLADDLPTMLAGAR